MTSPLAHDNSLLTNARDDAPHAPHAALPDGWLAVESLDIDAQGIARRPDGKVVFLNVQHPGEDTAAADIGDPSKYESHWPGNAGYGAGGATARPRSATVMVVKNDGGRIGT